MNTETIIAEWYSLMLLVREGKRTIEEVENWDTSLMSQWYDVTQIQPFKHN